MCAHLQVALNRHSLFFRMTTSISQRDAGMAANLKHIVAHSVRDNPVPLGPTAVTRGFEKTAFPKIVSLVWELTQMTP